jgi:hypothetical protein
MKTFDEFISEGKNKERQRLLSAYDRGRREGDPHMQTSIRHIETMTPDQVLKNSGRRAILRHIENERKAAENRRKGAITGIMKRAKKRGDSLEEKVINYPMAVSGIVYDRGKKRRLSKGKAMAKRSSSSGSGCGS